MFSDRPEALLLEMQRFVPEAMTQSAGDHETKFVIPAIDVLPGSMSRYILIHFFILFFYFIFFIVFFSYFFLYFAVGEEM